MNTHELAWAAGFFDGEGTTYGGKVKGPMLSVVQKTTPLLLRFQTAVGGLGNLWIPSPESEYIPAWRAQSFEHAQAVLVYLWPWLGEVKRAQATVVFKANRERIARVGVRRKIRVAPLYGKENDPEYRRQQMRDWRARQRLTKGE